MRDFEGTDSRRLSSNVWQSDARRAEGKFLYAMLRWEDKYCGGITYMFVQSCMNLSFLASLGLARVSENWHI